MRKVQSVMVLALVCAGAGQASWAVQQQAAPGRQSSGSQNPGQQGPAAQGSAGQTGAGPAGAGQGMPDAPQPVGNPQLGGRLHGGVKSGSVPLPGVAVTATNTLTGKRYATVTDVTGAWSMTIPQNGRYVIRTEFTAFAASTQEAVFNAASLRDQAVNFELALASRVVEQTGTAAAQSGASGQGRHAVRQLGAGTQALSLLSALGDGTESAAGGSANSGVQLPVAGGADVSGDSVAVTGQAGQVSPMAGQDMDHLRDEMNQARANGGTGLMQAMGGGPGGFGGPGGGPGGPGGPGGFGGGPGGFGGRGNFRKFRADQPHGSAFWNGSNSALNALSYSLRGQQQEQPPYGSNQFGLTLMGEPYLPGLSKPSGKDTVFFTLSGTRSSTASDLYGIVPTDAQRSGDLSATTNKIYVPGTDTVYQNNQVPVSAAAAALLQYYPQPNISGAGADEQNYHRITTAQSNTTQAGVRYMRSIGSNAGLPGMGGPGGMGGMGGGMRHSEQQGLRQSLSANFNWSHAASDTVTILPDLGGKSATKSYSLQLGYTLGYKKLNNSLTLGWNRNNASAGNYFTGVQDIATAIGILGPDENPLNSSSLNWGLPNVTLSNLQGMSETQPSLRLQQVITLSDSLRWRHGTHNLRFGGDVRRVHQDFLGGSNATGTFIFTGYNTESPTDRETTTGDATTGSSLADFLLGLPQETTISSSIYKSYLRETTFDLYAMDDWRAAPRLTINYGVRYEYFSPYVEKYDHLSMVDTNADAGFTEVSEVNAGGVSPYNGKLARSLVSPFRVGILPSLGIALGLPKSTVIRAGYGINFTNGQYAGFAQTLAHQPPYANVQTNEVTSGTALTLADGFPATQSVGTYALDPHYRLPYVQVWNIDVQKTLPFGVVMNVGYNGSKGTHLDITSAPRTTTSSPDTNPDDVLFNYEQSVAFSNFNAATLRVNKRLQKGVALGAAYQYSHSIDDAGSIGGTSTVVAQNWQDLLAEEGNSSFDVRHRVTGTYLYELPFGPDKWLLSGNGVVGKIVEGWSVSGAFTFATGTPLTPSYAAAVSDVARGTAGTLRPDRVAGEAIGGSGGVKSWFNVSAFTAPSGTYGSASRNSIPGPGTITNNMSMSKTMQLGDTRSFEFRATANNVFNTVQYSGVDTNLSSPTAGQVTSTSSMRSFSFTGRYRF